MGRERLTTAQERSLLNSFDLSIEGMCIYFMREPGHCRMLMYVQKRMFGRYSKPT